MTLSSNTRSKRTGIAAANGAAKKTWHFTGSGRARHTSGTDNEASQWSHWAEYLASRQEPVPLAGLIDGKSWPLSWSLPEAVASSDTPQLLAQLQQLAKRPNRAKQSEAMLLAWIDRTPATRLSAGRALEAIGWCHAMPNLAKSVSPDAWWSLLDRLQAISAGAARLDLKKTPLLHQLLCGELGLTLAYLLPELAACRKAASPARKALTAGLVELLDGEGLLSGPHIASLRPLLACWTRCRAMGEELERGCWTSSAEAQYEWFVRAALRMTRQDGSQVLGDRSAGAWCKDLMDCALAFGGDAKDHRIAELVLPGAKKPKKHRRRVHDLPGAQDHSEWAAVTVLRPGWHPDEPRLTVVYPDKDVDIELECSGELLLSGRWHTEICADGRPVRCTSDWEEICWDTDDDVDYLELEVQLSGGLRLQRHILLARQMRVAMLADSILGKRPSRLDYRSTLPVPGSMRFQPAEETHEGFLLGKKRRALVLPLALPEWRCDPQPDRLLATDAGLELYQSATAQNLFAPLWFDLDPRRMANQLTWRRLTVAENLQAVANETAVGYRVMVGKSQWLVYRSLQPAANRTLLGHNLSTQMVVGTFEDGEVEPMLAIE